MEFGYDFWLFIVRWLHVLSGVMWIGLLWYFNFVQTPTVPTIPKTYDLLSQNILCRWHYFGSAGQRFNCRLGLNLSLMNGYLAPSLAIGLTDNVAKHAMIGIGMWMGLIMAFNVWFIIWPNQQKVIGLVEASTEEKPKAARAAALASRTNTMLSIPMLYAMVAAQNLY